MKVLPLPAGPWRKAADYVLPGHAHFAHRLPRDGLRIRVETHRRGTGVLVSGQVAGRALAAGVGKLIVDVAVGAAPAHDFAQPLGSHEAEQLFEDAGGKLDVRRKLDQAQLSAQEQNLGQELDEREKSETRFLDAARRRWNVGLRVPKHRHRRVVRWRYRRHLLVSLLRSAPQQTARFL